MSKTPHEHHNDGQHDRSEGNGYSPPHGLLESVLTWSHEGSQQIAENNNAYRDGWNHTDSQKK